VPEIVDRRGPHGAREELLEEAPALRPRPQHHSRVRDV
jgi:hypothetical protein